MRRTIGTFLYLCERLHVRRCILHSKRRMNAKPSIDTLFGRLCSSLLKAFLNPGSAGTKRFFNKWLFCFEIF